MMAQEMMQAIRVYNYGSPEQLILEEAPRPIPAANEVLIHIHATGILPIEWKVRQGDFQKFSSTTFPYTPGSSFAGIIEEVGSQVNKFQKGQAVFGRSIHGTYAEYTTTPTDTIAIKPESLSFEEAATISGGATTAWSALFDNANLQAGQRVLIHGGAGGVGLFAIQFARLQDARVITTTSKKNLDFVRSLGANTAIDYMQTPFQEAVDDVDVVLDTIGGSTLRRSFKVLKPGGRLVSLLENPSQERAQELGIQAMKNSVQLPFPSTHLLEQIANLIAQDQVKAILGQSFSLRDAAKAHTLSETGHGRGRIILKIRE